MRTVLQEGGLARSCLLESVQDAGLIREAMVAVRPPPLDEDELLVCAMATVVPGQTVRPAGRNPWICHTRWVPVSSVVARSGAVHWPQSPSQANATLLATVRVSEQPVAAWNAPCRSSSSAPLTADCITGERTLPWNS